MIKGKYLLIGILSALVIQACNSQASRRNCPLIINKSKHITVHNIDSLCTTLEKISEKDGGIFFYVSDALPSHSEKDNIAYSFFHKKPLEKGVVVFIDFHNKKFTILYNDSLNSEMYRVKREAYGQRIYDLVSKEYEEGFFYSTIKAFEELFIQKQKKPF